MRCCLVGGVVGEEASASAADLLLVDLEGVTVLHVELYIALAATSFNPVRLQHARMLEGNSRCLGCHWC
jgi:hypothetical protein